MRLKVYLFNNPETGKVEEVYEYPVCFTPKGWGKYANNKNKLYSREPMNLPIILIPNKFIKEVSNQAVSVEGDYLDLTYYYGEINNKYDK